MTYHVPAWQLKLLSASDVMRIALDSPNISPATRLAHSGFAIMANAADQRAQGELEISDAYRRRR
jgi:hypothetical protein